MAFRPGIAVVPVGRRAGWLPAVAVPALLFAQGRLALRRYQRLPEVGYVVDTAVPVPGNDAVAPLRLVALGDSAVAGLGAPDVRDNLAVQTAALAAQASGRPVHVSGFGVSGARTLDVLTTQLPAAVDSLAGARPDVVLLVVGTNDLTHATAPIQFAQWTRRLLLAIRSEWTVPIVVCSLPEFRSMRAVPEPIRTGAAAYGRWLAREQRRAAASVPDAWWVDVRARVGHEFIRDPSTFAPDRFHPSPLGYALIAGSLAPAVVTAVGTVAAGRTAGGTVGGYRSRVAPAK